MTPAPSSGRVPVLLGLDSGQTACKAALIDLQGREVAVAGLANAVRSPRPHWVERDMEELFDQVCGAVRTALGRARDRLDGDVEVIGMGLCGHGDGVYLVDRDHHAIRAAILATDSRARARAAAFGEGTIGSRALSLTGQVPFAGSPAAILSWLAEHEPQSLQRTRWALFCKDYIRLRLTGTVATDPSEASASFTDVDAQRYSPAALDLYGLRDCERLLPPILDSDAVAGRLTAEAAAATGLAPGLPVATGAHDVDAAAVGIGAHQVGAASAVLGTFSINQVVADRPVADRRWQARAFVRAGHWLHMSTSPAGAANLDWAAGRIGPRVPGTSTADPAAAVAEAADLLGTGAGANPRAGDAPLFLPFLYGAPGGSGPGACWVGARGWHERADLLYAVLEGVVFNHRTHFDALADAFPAAGPVRVCGGGTASPEWTALLADALDRPVEITDAKEAGARGAALLAGVAVGAFADVADAVDRAVRVVRRHDPDPGRVAQLDERFGRYSDTVAALSSSGGASGGSSGGSSSGARVVEPDRC